MQEDPELFIYRRLHARYAERNRSLSGKSRVSGHPVKEGTSGAPDVDYLRLQVEFGFGDAIQKAPIFVRRAPSRKRQVSLFAQWKKEALAAVDAAINRNMEIPSSPSAERVKPGADKAGHAELFQAAESAVLCTSTEEMWRAEAQRGEAFAQTSDQAIDMLLNSWSALNLNGRSLEEIIRQSDVNQDGMLDKAELLAIMKANNLSVKEPDLEKVWRFLASSSSEACAKVGVEELQRAINLAVARKYLADWIGEIKIHELISSHLLSDCRQSDRDIGRAKNPVEYLVNRAPNEVLRQIEAAVPDIQRAVCKAFADFLGSTTELKRSTTQVW